MNGVIVGIAASWRPVAALVGLSVATFSYITSESLPIGLLDLISADLHTSAATVGLLVSAYGIVVVLVSVPLTMLIRRIPRRYLFSALLTAFVVATVASALAPNYQLLLVSRIATAVSHAVFWSVVSVTAAGLFPPRLRGRVVALLFAGSSLAAVLGVPAGTWLGQRSDWRAAFWALGGLGLLVLVIVAVTLPTSPPGASHAARGVAPDARRYWLLLATIVLAVTGTFVAFTYSVPFLTEVSGFPAAAIPTLLAIRGVAGVVGVLVSGALIDRFPRLVLFSALLVQVGSLLGLYLFGHFLVPAAVLLAGTGMSLSSLATTVTHRVLLVAPGSTDVAAAGGSTAFNVGITSGSFLGSLLLPAFGVRSTALLGGLCSLAAVGVVTVERWLPLPPPAGPAQPAPVPAEAGTMGS